MTIIGIDPGLNITGYGVIDSKNGHLQLLAAGTIRPLARKSLPVRLKSISDALEKIIKDTSPDLLVLESVYTHSQYLTTAAMMAHARGIACLMGAQHGLEVIEYLPTRIKKALTGHGTASKDQVAKAVGEWLGVDVCDFPSDATDALALAIAHAHIASSAAGALFKS